MDSTKRLTGKLGWSSEDLANQKMGFNLMPNSL